MDFRKPSKTAANEAFLKSLSSDFKKEPYVIEVYERIQPFLIICEGKNTEVGYFDEYGRLANVIVDVQGGKNSKNSLVDYALKQQQTDKYKGYEIWCVFDMDIKPDEGDTQPEDFNSAITKAEAAGLRVAWSNDAFELWFVLHFEDITGELTRNELYPILKKIWGLESFHNEAKRIEFCRQHYSRHGGRNSKEQNLAIKRAKKLHKEFDKRTDYAKHCPCTTVYLLVEELNRSIQNT